jgi:hypothetical protein
VDWIKVAQKMVQWWAVVQKVNNFLFQERRCISGTDETLSASHEGLASFGLLVILTTFSSVRYTTLQVQAYINRNNIHLRRLWNRLSKLFIFLQGLKKPWFRYSSHWGNPYYNAEYWNCKNTETRADERKIYYKHEITKNVWWLFGWLVIICCC